MKLPISWNDSRSEILCSRVGSFFFQIINVFDVLNVTILQGWLLNDVQWIKHITNTNINIDNSQGIITIMCNIWSNPRRVSFLWQTNILNHRRHYQHRCPYNFHLNRTLHWVLQQSLWLHLWCGRHGFTIFFPSFVYLTLLQNFICTFPFSLRLCIRL